MRGGLTKRDVVRCRVAGGGGGVALHVNEQRGEPGIHQTQVIHQPAAKFIIFSTKFLVFDTQFLVLMQSSFFKYKNHNFRTHTLR